MKNNKRWSKLKYQQYIIIYKRRRAELKAKKSTTPDYKKKLAVIKKHLDVYTRTLKKIRAREQKIQRILDLVKEFTGVDVYKNKRMHNENDIAKGIYFKYGMEHGILSTELSKYINLYKNTGSKNRMRFTRSFKTKPENKELYHKFLQYAKCESERQKI